MFINIMQKRLVLKVQFFSTFFLIFLIKVTA